ncbi:MULTISPECIES: hypothetical protein [unclassified Bradyrhizobium]|uniref:hypothetical protein n=1 Tax=unclassified Bradyrhizobium TaxID=2631580 RepID=UPI002FEE66B0
MNEQRSITIRWWVPLRDALLKSGSPSIAVIGEQRSERREGPTADIAAVNAPPAVTLRYFTGWVEPRAAVLGSEGQPNGRADDVPSRKDRDIVLVLKATPKE